MGSNDSGREGNMNSKERTELIGTLKARFEKNMNRHKGLDWSKVEAKLGASPDKLAVLAAMEASGGEPDVVVFDKKAGSLLFVDCSAESPAGRRSLCYDRAALDARKKNKPGGCVSDMAAKMGVELLTEEQYRDLQTLGSFDLKTSSWVKTPPDVRNLGGALFCDRRYDKVFVYHNGADSYYAVRGFRGAVSV